jgi:protoporphyrin/coproporphyrin ferrochelatase
VSPDALAGVLLMTYGSPASLDRQDVGAYLTRVRGGREPSAELVGEFARRYRVIGGSPLIAITGRQAASLESTLGWPVEIGMRFSAPSIEDGLRALADRGAERVVGIILSPQFSPLLMGGYERAIDEARAAIGAAAPVLLAPAWHHEPAFVEALADRIGHGLAGLGTDEPVAVLLTAHSLPRRVADQEPEYLGQLRETAESVATLAGLATDRWWFCWQSAGHQPGDWMTPDFADLMPALALEGYRSVLVAPVQFLADHLEILYDIDVGAREEAERAGLGFSRIASLNDDPGLVRALAGVARRTVEGGRLESVDLVEPQGLGRSISRTR